jgi:hypothetical protein
LKRLRFIEAGNQFRKEGKFMRDFAQPVPTYIKRGWNYSVRLFLMAVRDGPPARLTIQTGKADKSSPPYGRFERRMF